MNRVIVLKTIYSTNQYIIDNLKYMQSGDVCVTDHQTHGKGRYGKCWVTPYAQGIALSMYWTILNQNVLMTGALSLIVSFIVAGVLQTFGVYQVQIKWPNDLYIYGKKLGGILIEVITKQNQISHLIIGIGLNISICNNKKFTMKLGKNWIDLKSIGIFLDSKKLVASLIKELRRAMREFEYNQYVLFGYYYSHALDYLYNCSVAVLRNGCISYGTVIGISKDGMLLIRNRLGEIHQYLEDNISVYKI